MKEGRAPDGVKVADGYPTEFSHGVGESVGMGGAVGPYFVVDGPGEVVGELVLEP